MRIRGDLQCGDSMEDPGVNTGKRKSVSLQCKVAILERLKKGEANSVLSKEYGVPHSTISSIKKNAAKIETQFCINDPKRKRIRCSTQKEVEDALLRWLQLESNQGIRVNGPILLEQANFFVSQFNIPDFTCSMGWINRFRARYNIPYGILNRSKTIKDCNVYDWFGVEWPELRTGYSDDQIFSANEIELSFKGPEEKSEQKQEKLTALIAANMTGKIKKKMLVVGKPKNIWKTNPVDYHSHHKAIMTADTFIKWLREWDDALTEKKEKILLLIDLSSSHLPIRRLKSVTLVFLPRYLDSKLRPCKWMLEVLESNYRNIITQRTVAGQNIMLLDAISIAYNAWNEITEITIRNCFKLAGFVQSTDEDIMEEDSDSCDTDLIKIECVDEEDPLENRDQYITEDNPSNIKQQVDANSSGDKDKCVSPSVAEALETSDEYITEDIQANIKQQVENDVNSHEKYKCISPSAAEALESSDEYITEDILTNIKQQVEDDISSDEKDKFVSPSAAEALETSDEYITEDILTTIKQQVEDDMNSDEKDTFSSASAAEALLAAEVVSAFVNANFDDELKNKMACIRSALLEACIKAQT